MTVTLEIPSAIEAVLDAKAKLFGLALPDYLVSVLEANVDEEYSISVEEIASVQQALAEGDGGDKGMLLEEFRAEMNARIKGLKQGRLESVA